MQSVLLYIGHLESQLHNQRINFLDVLVARLLVAPALKPPIAVPLGAFGVGASKHIQRFGIPKINGFLQSLPALVSFGRQFCRLTSAVTYMANLLFYDVRQNLS